MKIDIHILIPLLLLGARALAEDDYAEEHPDTGTSVSVSGGFGGRVAFEVEGGLKAGIDTGSDSRTNSISAVDAVSTSRLIREITAATTQGFDRDQHASKLATEIHELIAGLKLQPVKEEIVPTTPSIAVRENPVPKAGLASVAMTRVTPPAIPVAAPAPAPVKGHARAIAEKLKRLAEDLLLEVE
jgi:hypothetical protein